MEANPVLGRSARQAAQTLTSFRVRNPPQTGQVLGRNKSRRTEDISLNVKFSIIVFFPKFVNSH